MPSCSCRYLFSRLYKIRPVSLLLYTLLTPTVHGFKFLLHVYLTAGLLWSNTTKTSQTSDIVLLRIQRQDGTVTEELIARAKSKERIRGARTISECGYCRSAHVLQSWRSRRVQTCPPQLWFQRALFSTLTQKSNENERARRPSISIASCEYHQQTVRLNIILFYVHRRIRESNF